MRLQFVSNSIFHFVQCFPCRHHSLLPSVFPIVNPRFFNSKHYLSLDQRKKHCVAINLIRRWGNMLSVQNPFFKLHTAATCSPECVRGKASHYLAQSVSPGRAAGVYKAWLTTWLLMTLIPSWRLHTFVLLSPFSYGQWENRSEKRQLFCYLFSVIIWHGVALSLSLLRLP